MVQKSIKKPQKKGEIEEKILNKEKKLVVIPKFIDPINCLHLYGDIIFIDKLDEDEIGIVSKYQNFKRIVNIEFHDESNSWTTDFVTPCFEPNSWRLICDRLTSLGSLSAYELAKTIENFFLLMEDQSQKERQEMGLNEESLEVISQVKYHQYLKDVQNFLKHKKNNIYLFLMFEMHSLQNGLELKKIGYSKRLVDLVWEDEFSFTDYTINFSFYDFITIRKEDYFDFIKNNFLRVFEQSNNIYWRFSTLEGIHINLDSPMTTTQFCRDENGNLQGMFLFYEFSVEETFLNTVAKSREKTTKISKRKNTRDDLLEAILQHYYGNGEFTQNSELKKTESDINLQAEGEKKRCGYRVLNE